MCPPIWKAVSGRVAMMICLSGLRMPFFNTGKASRTATLRLASQERKMHQKDTSMNWTTVKVIGFGRAVRMAFDEVFVRIEEAYQKLQRTLSWY